jgi:outer membrane protein TolC
MDDGSVGQAMDRSFGRTSGEYGGLYDVSQGQYERAVAMAREYVRAAFLAWEHARLSSEAAGERVMSAERTLRIARQTLARLQLLRRRYDRN